MATYRAESRTLNNRAEFRTLNKGIAKWLDTSERKVLTSISGGITVNENSRK